MEMVAMMNDREKWRRSKQHKESISICTVRKLAHIHILCYFNRKIIPHYHVLSAEHVHFCMHRNSHALFNNVTKRYMKNRYCNKMLRFVYASQGSQIF